jgi:magnesium-transporting ATPase (P-type)
MRRPPRDPRRPLLANSLLVRIAGAGGFSAFAALVLILLPASSLDHARWWAFTTLVVAQVVRAYANRSLAHPVHRLAANRLLAGAIVLVLVIQVAIPYLPPLAEIFRASPLDAGEWLLVAAVAVAPALVSEVIRSVRRTVWVA